MRSHSRYLRHSTLDHRKGLEIVGFSICRDLSANSTSRQGKLAHRALMTPALRGRRLDYRPESPFAASGAHRERRAEPAAILAAQAGKLPRSEAKISCNRGTACPTGHVSSMR